MQDSRTNAMGFIVHVCVNEESSASELQENTIQGPFIPPFYFPFLTFG